jgi:hypothetical protein
VDVVFRLRCVPERELLLEPGLSRLLPAKLKQTPEQLEELLPKPKPKPELPKELLPNLEPQRSPSRPANLLPPKPAELSKLLPQLFPKHAELVELLQELLREPERPPERSPVWPAKSGQQERPVVPLATRSAVLEVARSAVL